MHSSGRCLRRKRDVRSFAQSPDPCLLVLVLGLQMETQSVDATSLVGSFSSTFLTYIYTESAYVSGGSPGLCRCCHCCCPGWCSSGLDHWPPNLGCFFFQDCHLYHVQTTCVHPDGLGSHHCELLHPAVTK